MKYFQKIHLNQSFLCCTTSASPLRHLHLWEWWPKKKKEEEGGGDEEEVASMALTLYSLIQTAILCTNAIAVLHEERFLSKSKYSDTFYTTYIKHFNEMTTYSKLTAAS